MTDIDCLIIGQHDPDFEQYVRTMRFTFGQESGAYQDQDLTFVNYQGKPYRVMDLLNVINTDRVDRPLSNFDFLWPTIVVLGSFLAKHGMSFDYVNQYRYERDLLRRKLQENRYRVVAVTTTLYTVDIPIREVVSFIRQFDREVSIVIGGPYIKNRSVESTPVQLDGEWSRMGGDVYVISSEGQLALVNTIRALKGEIPLRSVDNIAFRKTLLDRVVTPAAAPAEGRRPSLPVVGVAPSAEAASFVFNAASVEDNALEENPINFDVFPRHDLTHFFSLSTAKSCPYACLFCSFPTRAGEYKTIDVAAVERAMDRLRELGVHTLTFNDDTFNVPRARFKAILRMMIKNGYGFRWNSFYRSDQGDEETIALMAESGCEGVFLGIESASDIMLKKMNKTSSRKHYAAAVPALKARRIHAHANFIIGFPGETPETILETLNFIKEFQPDTYKIQLWYAENTSPVWKKREELKIDGQGFDWTHLSMTSTEASRWIDRIFEEVTESDVSAFLPQESFGLWSVFYLQRHGIPHGQIMDFLKQFARGVLAKRRMRTTADLPVDIAQELLRLGRIPVGVNRLIGPGALALAASP